MKVEVKQDGENPLYPLYPRLMKFHDNVNFIVLFISREEGVVLKSDDINKPIGYYANDWYMENFTDFKGSITITQ